jgi:hypothetical protein
MSVIPRVHERLRLMQFKMQFGGQVGRARPAERARCDTASRAHNGAKVSGIDESLMVVESSLREVEGSQNLQAVLQVARDA